MQLLKNYINYINYYILIYLNNKDTIKIFEIKLSKKLKVYNKK